MRLSQTVKPISFFKAHAAEIIRDLSENRGTMIITQNGEAKAVVQDIREYEKTQDSLAMMKLLAISQKSLERGKFRPADDVFRDLKNKNSEDVSK